MHLPPSREALYKNPWIRLATLGIALAIGGFFFKDRITQSRAPLSSAEKLEALRKNLHESVGSSSRLSDGEKLKILSQYRETPAEALELRGKLVGRLTRNVTTIQDLEFLQAVAQSPPCLSLSDCSRPDAARVPDPEEEIGQQLTLAFPQLAAIKVLQKTAQDFQQTAEIRQKALAELESLTRAKNDLIAGIASESIEEIEDQAKAQ